MSVHRVVRYVLRPLICKHIRKLRLILSLYRVCHATMTQALNTNKYSKEQEAYILFEGVGEDTKLLATAGSGKTFCIIHHIMHLIDANIFAPTDIIMLTFSKNAKDDFVSKVRRAKLETLPRSNILTIDSFAYRLLGGATSQTQTDVSILSYTLMLALEDPESSNEDILARFPRLKSVKCIFIDEAQDLNDTQYRLLLALKTRCGASLNFVGDPNQNIFQFRSSSDKYLVNHVARVFHLTKNFRSCGHIVDFCSFLRPYNTVEVTHAQPRRSLDITFYAYDTTSTFENFLLSVLYMFQGKKIPLHKCAVLAPTRGYLRDPSGLSKYKGLCYIANLLFTHGIPFQQFYSDTGMEDGVSKLHYKPVKDSLNLMTYTSSKGLEWDYVIIVDANAHLITRRDYTRDKFNAEKYLLYVACSRPRKNLIIFTKRNVANPWFRDVPEDKYKVARICQHNFDFYDTSKLFDLTPPIIVDPCMSLKSAVLALDEPSLYKISSLLTDEHLIKCTHRAMYDLTNGEIWRPSCGESMVKLLSKFFEHMFHLFSGSGPLTDTLLIDVINVVNQTNIILCNNEFVIQWYFNNRGTVTWASWETEKANVHPNIVNFVESYLDHGIPFGAFTIVDKFYDTLVLACRPIIMEAHEKYLENPMDVNNTFFLTLVAYAIQTTHYFYIKQSEKFEQEVFTENNREVLKLMESYCRNDIAVTDRLTLLSNEKMKGCADIVLSDNEIACFLFSNGVSLKDLIIMVAMNSLLPAQTQTQTQTKCSVFNLKIGIHTTFDLAHLPVSTVEEIVRILLGVRG